MHSSTDGFLWRSHFVYGLRWRVMPKWPSINLRRFTEMPLSAPSEQYTVCHFVRHAGKVFLFFSFFFSVFCQYMHVLIPLNIDPSLFFFFPHCLQLVPSVILVCFPLHYNGGWKKNSASSIAQLQVLFLAVQVQAAFARTKWQSFFRGRYRVHVQMGSFADGMFDFLVNYTVSHFYYNYYYCYFCEVTSLPVQLLLAGLLLKLASY